jgi:para-aminobenzoate synthetase/4-amino-4-deoxychorismate lyase
MAHLPGEGLRNLDRHLDRLADSAALFGFAFDRAAVTARLSAAVDPAVEARVRLVLSRSGVVDVWTAPLPVPLDRPVRLALDTEPIDAESVWLRHKTTRRGVYAERAARHRDADDVILVDGQGRVTETTIANLAVRLDGQWWTPPLSAGCLPGVERGRLVEAGVLRERELTVADVERAEELAVVSSLRGWRPAVPTGAATRR